MRILSSIFTITYRKTKSSEIIFAISMLETDNLKKNIINNNIDDLIIG